MLNKIYSKMYINLMSIVHYVVLRKIEEMEIQTVMKRNEEGRRSSSSVFFHRTFSYFYKFLLVNF